MATCSSDKVCLEEQEILNSIQNRRIGDLTLWGDFATEFENTCQSQSNKGPNTRGKKGPLRLVFCGALAGVLVI